MFRRASAKELAISVPNCFKPSSTGSSAAAPPAAPPAAGPPTGGLSPSGGAGLFDARDIGGGGWRLARGFRGL